MSEPPGGGSGGIGSGGAGDGSGAGAGSDDAAQPARQIGGDFRSSDFPRSARAASVLRIGVRFEVLTSGRVGECAITRSSGYPDLDAATCAVIARRYRFEPARDGENQPVVSVIEEDEVWSREKDGG